MAANSSPLVIDLHSHSTCSDGGLSPRELVQEAHQRGVTTLALTDHDTTAGIEDARAVAEQLEIELVAGVEFTCEAAGREIHLLGLGVDIESEPLQELCSEIRNRRFTRFLKMHGLLEAAGIKFELPELTENDSLARPVMARLLIEAGYAQTYDEAFRKYLRPGCPGYFAHSCLPIDAAIEAVRAARGVSFVAHPGNYRNGDEVVAEALDKGADGIECYHPDHDEVKTRHFEEIALSRGGLVSGGSDFHRAEHARSAWFGRPACPPEHFDRMMQEVAARC